MIDMVKTFIGGLSSILVGLIGLGILANILFGSNMIVGDVIGNISSIVTTLGSQGLVGLIVAIIVIHVLGIDSANK
tara:strand:- start:160 stop:387 length:228 start_codon:yes stop_codon:yes gene_type:complete